jgi:hypothetical protein
MILEKNNFDNNIISTPENIERKKVRETLFAEIVEGKLYDSYIENMKAAGFSQEDTNNFREELSQLSEQDRMYVLSLPWELKQNSLPFYKQQIEKGRFTISDMINNIIKITKDKNNFQICYHSSNTQIEPEKKFNPYVGRDVNGWVIKGTEKDHRDEDQYKAYYSKDYQHLYRTKNPKYLYLVAVNQSSTKNDGAWGRASSLSVIDKINIPETEKELEEGLQEFDNKKKAKNAA